PGFGAVALLTCLTWPTASMLRPFELPRATIFAPLPTVTVPALPPVPTLVAALPLLLMFVVPRIVLVAPLMATVLAALPIVTAPELDPVPRPVVPLPLAFKLVAPRTTRPVKPDAAPAVEMPQVDELMPTELLPPPIDTVPAVALVPR